MTLFNIFLTFLKIGFLAFGGGYAILPILEREFVDKKQWLSQEQLMEDFAIANSIPGIIVVNTATFIGYRLKGVKGALSGAIGIIIPSILIITIVAAFFQNFADIPWIQRIFKGLNIAIIVLLIGVIVKMWKRGICDIVTFLIFGAVVILYIFTDFNPALFVILGALTGLLLAGRNRK